MHILHIIKYFMAYNLGSSILYIPIFGSHKDNQSIITINEWDSSPSSFPTGSLQPLPSHRLRLLLDPSGPFLHTVFDSYWIPLTPSFIYFLSHHLWLPPDLSSPVLHLLFITPFLTPTDSSGPFLHYSLSHRLQLLSDPLAPSCTKFFLRSLL